MSQIFEIVQSLSGQRNSITIPVPYLDFFSGDQQAHALGAILNQLVFWSGKSDLTDGWFYKEHSELAAEIRGVSEDQVQRLVNKICTRWLPGVVEKAQRQVNGTKKTHYRIDGDALINALFPANPVDSAESRNGKREVAEPITQNRGTETADSQNPNREVAEPILYTDHYTDHHKQISKPSCPAAAQQDEARQPKDFLSRHPDAVVYDVKKRQWGRADDLTCAQWMWKKVRKLYEDAAELDATVAIPEDPDWALWANEIRLMSTLDGHAHKQICELFSRVNKDEFWKMNIRCPSKLRAQWNEVSLKLSQSANRQPVREDKAFKSTHSQVDYSLPENAGFRS